MRGFGSSTIFLFLGLLVGAHLASWGTGALAAEDSAASLIQETQTRISPFPVGSRAQLFIDPTLVREAQNVAFTQHQGVKHPANPIMVADKPWEGWRIEIYGNVLFDDEASCYKMWYWAEGVGKFAGLGATCYATSKDGIHWEKPLVGTLDDGTGKPNNIVLNGHLASVVKDGKDPDPARRYKMTCSRPDPRSPPSSAAAPRASRQFGWGRG